ncbi:hypothetical protein C7271_11020 [filamentous cyanobacterium CCP5]|nr:hypothetical protein C7271_11020 [filamentous cyanobacterium CCP5]
MQAYRLKTIVSEDGTVTLQGLPFRPGETVEIIVLEEAKAGAESAAKDAPLQGSVLQYDNPFEPVDAEAWELA